MVLYNINKKDVMYWEVLYFERIVFVYCEFVIGLGKILWCFFFVEGWF